MAKVTVKAMSDKGERWETPERPVGNGSGAVSEVAIYETNKEG